MAKFSPVVVLALLAFGQFGAGKASASIERIYTLPFYSSYQVTCPWGPYSNCIPGKPGNHNGTDYSLGRNTTSGEVVAAAAAGTLKRCPYDQFGAGNYAVIDHANGHRTRYLHLLNQSIPDQSVARGQMIGYEGSTGDSSGPHLHFDTRHGATTFSCSLNSTDGTSVDPYAGPYSPGTYMWEDQPPGGQPPNHAEFAPAVASWTSNRVDVFIRGQNNDIYQRTWNGSSWSGWTRPRPGSCLRSAPAASTWSTTRVDVFYRGCDNDLFQLTWNGTSWSHTRPQPGQCLLSSPAATSWGVGLIDVFFRGCDNDLFQISGNGSFWSPASRPWPGSCLRSAPGAVAPTTNRIELAYRGCDDAIWDQSYNNGTWSRQSFGGCTMVAPAVASWASNKIDVFHRGCESVAGGAGIFQKSYNGSSWLPVVNLGGCLASGPGADAWAPDWLTVLYRGCSSPATVWKAYYNGSSWTHVLFGSSWP